MATRTVARAQQYHGGPKAGIIGGGKRTNAGAPAPAWRARNMPSSAHAGKQVRSKVLLSNLPVDVDEEEIVVSYLCYNYSFLCEHRLHLRTIKTYSNSLNTTSSDIPNLGSYEKEHWPRNHRKLVNGL